MADPRNERRRKNRRRARRDIVLAGMTGSFERLEPRLLLANDVWTGAVNGNWNLAAGEALTFAWGTTQYPAGPGGSKVYPGGEGLAIGAFSKQQDLAWDYLETAWLSKQGQIANYGATGQIPVRADVAVYGLLL